MAVTAPLALLLDGGGSAWEATNPKTESAPLALLPADGGGGKPKACTSAYKQWGEATLKSGKKIPLLQPYEFCVEADTYEEAQKSAQAQAKAFLDGIEAEKLDRERRQKTWEKTLQEQEWKVGPRW